MNSILRTVRLVAWRLTINRALAALLRGAFYVLCVFAVVALVDRLFYLGFSPYAAMFLALLAMVPYAALNLAMRPVHPHQAALAIDQRLDLHERLSTALAIRGEAGPAVEAVLMDAQRHAESINPRQHFPYQYPIQARYILFPALAIFLVWSVVPSFDLFKREAAVEEQKKSQKQLLQVAQDIKKRSAEHRKQLEKIESVSTEKLMKQLDEASEALRAAKDKKEAFLKLSEVGDKLKDRQEELKKLMESKNRFQPDGLAKMTKELQEALGEGDYKAAKRQLEKLADEIRKNKEEMAKDGKLDERKLEELGREMQRLAEQLEESDMEELAEAMKQAADQMAEAEAPEDLEKALDSLKQGENQLEQLEQLAQELQMLETAMEEIELAKDALSGSKNCKSGQLGMRVGGGKKGLKAGKMGKAGGNCPGGNGQGGGGGSGKGTGERERGKLESAQFEQSKVSGRIGKGPILGSFFVKGMPPKGESNVEYRDAVTNYKAAAEEALDKERIPANYRELVRDYFDAIENPVVQQP